jgi:5-methylcytosine-specific restriction endonuclease McrA
MSRPYISVELERQIIADAGHRCGYCRSDEALTGISLSTEHIVPVSAGGLTVRENLWRSCRPCNEIKGSQTHAEDSETHEVVPLFNPRAQRWDEHFAWSDDGTQILGLTAIGRATIVALQLNRPLLVSARRRWVLVGWHPPQADMTENPSA